MEERRWFTLDGQSTKGSVHQNCHVDLVPLMELVHGVNILEPASSRPGTATEFLKIIRHNEYELLDQLNKTPAHVSLPSLLINSKGHHQLLLKVLNEAHMAQDITLEKFRGIVNNIMANNYVTFSEEEILVERKAHNQPLHISVKCRNYMLARVFIDNGSSLNVMPKATLEKLYSTGA
ncbi:hypothetical protein CR513_01312, partial [Mucuna pruriens]